MTKIRLLQRFQSATPTVQSINEQDRMELGKGMGTDERPFVMPPLTDGLKVQWDDTVSVYLVKLCGMIRDFWFVPVGVAMILYGLSGSTGIGLAIPVACLALLLARVLFWRPINTRMKKLARTAVHLVGEDACMQPPSDPSPGTTEPGAAV